MNDTAKVLREGSTGRRSHEASWFVLVPTFLLFLAALVAAGTAPAIGATLLIIGVFGGLAVAGLRWGADSRDGSDWMPRNPGAIR